MVKKSYRIIWSDEAVSRAHEIYEWNKEHYSEQRASKIFSSILDAVEGIPDSPFGNPRCYELEEFGEALRKILVEKTFWIVYEIATAEIIVHEIIHGARDPKIYQALSSQIKSFRKNK